MEEVRKFDEELKKLYSYEILMGKVVWIFCVIMVCLMMLLPIQEGMQELCAVSQILLLIGVNMYMQPFMVVYENRKAVSIYQKLKWLPVEKREMKAVRRSYLNAFVGKVLIACLILQQAGALLNGSWYIGNVLYPTGVCAFAWLMGMAYIYGTK